MLKVKDFRKQKDLTTVQQKELEDRLHKAFHEGCIFCATALTIAKSLEIPADDVGRTANKLNIRIKKCLIGCF
jgi:LAO/AO transport system kinase